MRLFFLLVERADAGRKRSDRRAGEVVAMLYNAHRDANTKAWTWTDVFPEWHEEREQTEEEMFNNMMLWATAGPFPAARN